MLFRQTIRQAIAGFACALHNGIPVPEFVDTCLQFHGGYGHMDDYPISRLYSDARISRVFGGSNEIMRMLIARTM